jgi:hypothetical protein
LSHYASRIPALEHRYLVAYLLLGRIEGCELVFLTCQAPGEEILDYYASLLPAHRRVSARARLRGGGGAGPRPLRHRAWGWLASDGRFGLTAIGRSPGQAAELHHATKSVTVEARGSESLVGIDPQK